MGFHLGLYAFIKFRTFKVYSEAKERAGRRKQREITAPIYS